MEKVAKRNDAQGELFNEVEQLSDPAEPEDSDVELNTEQPDPPKKKKKGRTGLSPDLPQEKILLRLSDEQKQGAIDTFFVTVKEKLDITPAKIQVLQYQQEKAVFLDEQGTRTLIEADRPKHPLGKAIASTALLAYLITAKYCDGLPLDISSLIRKQKNSREIGGNCSWRSVLTPQSYPQLPSDVKNRYWIALNAKIT